MRRINKLLGNIAFKELLASCVFLFLITYVVINAQGANVLSSEMNPYIKQFNKTVFMESFGFFTKSPKSDEQFSIYKISTKGPVKMDLRNNSSYNLYGLSRKNRVRLVEIGNVAKSVKEDMWETIQNKAFDSCILKYAESVHYNEINISLQALSEGKYILTMSKLIPWEWNHLKETYELKYVAVDITDI